MNVFILISTIVIVAIVSIAIRVSCFQKLEIIRMGHRIGDINSDELLSAYIYLIRRAKKTMVFYLAVVNFILINIFTFLNVGDLAYSLAASISFLFFYSLAILTERKGIKALLLITFIATLFILDHHLTSIGVMGAITMIVYSAFFFFTCSEFEKL